ncbi:MAG: DUF1194 domain-containing protein [Hyphomicrobiales bacterium]
MRAVCLIIYLSVFWFAQFFSTYASADTGEVDLELVLAVDASGSVDPDEFNLQLNGIATGISDEGVIAAIKQGPKGRIAINLIVWAEAGYPKQTSGWMVIGSAQDARAVAAKIAGFPRKVSGGTGLGDGLAVAIRSFDENLFNAERRVVDVSGDGRETTPRNFTVQLNQARAMAYARSVTVNALAILNEDRELDTYYRENLQTGRGSFVVAVARYEDFAEAMRKKLLREITYRPKVSEGRRHDKFRHVELALPELNSSRQK